MSEKEKMQAKALELTPELEKELRLRIAARNIKIAAEKREKSKNHIGSCIGSGFSEFCRSMADKTKKSGIHEDKEKEVSVFRDEKGREFVKRSELHKIHDAEAFKRHGNDPLTRFDEWDFPGTMRERAFILNHDFGINLQNSLESLNNGGWVYAFGDVGQGKTALAMRAMWEILQTKFSLKASFIFMNQYSMDQIKRETAELKAIQRGEEMYRESLNYHEYVILDDFDKVNYGNEHKLRTVLDFIEKLKKGKHKVFMTSNLSLKAMWEKYQGMEDVKPLLDRVRQMCHILPEFKGKSKRQSVRI